MAEPRPYYSERGLSAAYYDLITAHDADLAGDVDLYAGLAPEGGAILELGAGTGRIALALAQRGFTVTGVDLAPAMLAQAQAKRAKADPATAGRVEFRRGDMTALALGRTFDAVISTFHTLAHVPAGAAWTNSFQVLARHARSGGKVAVHLPRVDLMSGPGPSNPSLPVMQLETGQGVLQLFIRSRRFRDKINRMDQVLEYRVLTRAGAVEQQSLERQTYYMTDPRPFADAAGLVQDGEPVRLGGSGDVWVFRKP